MAEKRRHRVSIVIEGQELDGWTSYEISTSMIEPADGFTMTRPFDPKAWGILRLDARVRVLIDGIVIMDGYIDSRRKASRDHSMTIVGRDRGGRLVQESAPSISYQGLELTEAVRRLVSPWYSKVTLSDARNRKIRLGKGRKVATGTEPIIVKRSASGAGRVSPGQFRWTVIEELVSQAGLIAWGSADGAEFFVGLPNQIQAPQFLVINGGASSGVASTCKELDYEEDNGDRYSRIDVVGTGGGNETDFGDNVTSRRGVARDSTDAEDGTGGDFLYPKRLMMPERAVDSNQDAQEIADRERARRDFRRETVTAIMEGHGQFVGPGAPTIFATNTIASVTDYEMDPILDGDYLIHTIQFRAARDAGEETTLEMVPRGTTVVL